jgi:hypothetical protein
VLVVFDFKKSFKFILHANILVGGTGLVLVNSQRNQKAKGA